MNMLTKLNENVFIINHQHHLNQTYKVCLKCHKEKLLTQLKIKEGSFNIKEPHISTLTCDDKTLMKHKNSILLNSGDKQKKRKRKRKFPLNKGEIASIEYHEKVYPHLKKAYNIFELYKESPNKDTSLSNSLEVSQCNSQCLNLICLKCTGMIDSFIRSGSMLYNCQNFPVIFNYDNQKYVCPPKSSFVVSDIQQTEVLVENSENFGKFNCIVADPPWENKSVKRGKKYNWLTNQQIKELLPVKRIVSDKCLVVMWVTNKQKIMNFVKDDLFKDWGFKYLTEWHWIKVTKSGVPVFPFESAHKKPYETILVGCTPQMEEYLTKNSIDINNKVIFSVPSTTHSHKPPLNDILNLIFERFDSEARFVELFARSLMPGWVSWGNETLKMQNLSYFESSEI